MKPNTVQIGDVARVTGQSVGELQHLADHVRSRYRARLVEKDGKRRALLIPDEELKEIQRRIYDGLLRPIKCGHAVHSAPGRSILTNARAHVRHPHLSVFDIKDCFPSITPRRVAAALRRAGFRSDVAWLITRLTTVHNELPQGAPTSPALLNLVLVDLDGKLESIAQGAGLVYSRYADDLFLSGGERTFRLASVVERVVRRHKLRINAEKRIDLGPTQEHRVTRIVVNTRPNPLPEYLESLRVVVERHASGTAKLEATELLSVRGKVAYVRSLNPDAALPLEAGLR